MPTMTNYELTVLTWNIYLGGNHVPLLGATPQQLPARMSALWQQVQNTFFPARARAIAAVLARTRPDVIALQEVMRWSVDQRPQLHVPQPVIVYDFIALLLGELAARRVCYALAARSPGVDVLLPTTEGFDVHFEDAVVILARVPTPDEKFTWSNPRAERFSRNITAPIGNQLQTLSRQWTSLDLMLGNRPVRFVNAHVEYADPAVSEAQCAELLTGPAEPRDRPVILVGDFNADAETGKTWKTLTDKRKAKFVDAFCEVGKEPGATWGQAEDLRNARSQLTRRLDWVLYRGQTHASSATVVGVDPGDRTPEGMWPSDHAGVLAGFRLEQQ
jgi:endonuclease/exonuclease/phosphatase family metal-dependent hydrolase